MLIKSVTPCDDALVVGHYQVPNPLCLIVLTAKSDDYTTAQQQQQYQALVSQTREDLVCLIPSHDAQVVGTLMNACRVEMDIFAKTMDYHDIPS